MPMTRLDGFPAVGDLATSRADLDAMLDRFRLPRGEFARSIAVVGSSGNMLYRGFGEAIDAHDIVIRVNGARYS